MAFHTRDDGMPMLDDIALSDDVFQEFMPVMITPSIRDYLLKKTRSTEQLPATLALSREGGTTMLNIVACLVCESYMKDLTADERLRLHLDAMTRLETEASELRQRKEWREIIAESMLATLHGFAGPPRSDINAFVDAITNVKYDTWEAIVQNNDDYENEKSWQPVPDCQST